MTYRPDNPYDRMRFGVLPDDGDAGRDLAMVNYVLLILGFFTGITAIIAVVLAYARRARSFGMVRSHLDWQIRIFWHGVIAFLTIAVLHAIIVGFAAITFGIGLVFMVVPWAIGLAWLVWTIWAIAKGLRRLSRSLPIG